MKYPFSARHSVADMPPSSTSTLAATRRARFKSTTRASYGTACQRFTWVDRLSIRFLFAMVS
jgi:hypothetical protein